MGVNKVAGLRVINPQTPPKHLAERGRQGRRPYLVSLPFLDFWVILE